jgi:hypothetical protein
MNSPAPLWNQTDDPVALAVEHHLHEMDEVGLGHLVCENEGDAVWLTFGHVTVRAETYEIALMKLAGALLSDSRLGAQFTRRFRNSAHLTRY